MAYLTMVRQREDGLNHDYPSNVSSTWFGAWFYGFVTWWLDLVCFTKPRVRTWWVEPLNEGSNGHDPA